MLTHNSSVSQKTARDGLNFRTVVQFSRGERAHKMLAFLENILLYLMLLLKVIIIQKTVTFCPNIL